MSSSYVFIVYLRISTVFPQLLHQFYLFVAGDRILSVTVSFENMVYEDALTILSYASPYPVQICLQKQEQMPKSRRISTTKTSLNHPLYRSQSVDALHGLGKELMFHPKRSLSEMRPDKRDSPKLKHVSKSSIEKDISEEINLSNGKANQSIHKSIPAPTTAEVIVHRDDSRNDVKKEISYDKQFSIDTGLPNATVDLNHRNENKIDTRLANQTREGTDELDSASQLRQDSNHTGFVDEFSKLTEQDKLDVLRLSYEDSNVDFSNIVQNHVVETEIAPTVVDGDLKAAVAPVKPERKKKRNSSSSLDGDIPISPRSMSADDDAIVAILQPPTEAPPPVPDGEQEFEADEEIITPQSKERIISVDTEKISFEPITPVKLDMSDISIDKTITGHDESFSDADKTLVNSPSQFDRPPSPDEEPVIEDEIAPTQLRKGDLQMTALNIITNFETKQRQRAPDMNTPLPEKVINETNAINETEKLKVGNNSSVDEFENEFPNLDMNLNFESDSVLFKDTFPNRNTKENDGGMSYDISVTELEAMENKKLKELAEQNDNQKSSGGIAFEVRDDYVSGNQQTVTTKSVHRTSSYDISKSNETPLDRIKLSDRPNSMKVDIKKSSEFDNGDLDWSGKRLVRSGSFTEIPQDDSVKNWTDNNNLSEDDIVIEQLIQEDSASTNLKKLTKATSIKATTIIDELSDSDSHCRSLSSSSSESSQERESYNITTNGPDDGLGSSPDSSPVKIKSDMKSEIISPISHYSEKGQSITVTLNTSMENDEDC